MTDEYREARMMALSIASRAGSPRFYRDHRDACTRSRRLFDENGVVHACREIVKEKQGPSGHGLSHADKVALDAGAIVIVEQEGAISEAALTRLVLLAHLAGLLHDIERSRRDHARRGAREAAAILGRLELPPDDVAAVADAIRNHEAFQPIECVNGRTALLLSDALYDADKFRWGPDNFTEMLWDMLALRPVPMAKLMGGFLPGLQGIASIRETFRSRTGKVYGPDFIDRGIEIGHELYGALSKRFVCLPERP